MRDFPDIPFRIFKVGDPLSPLVSCRFLKKVYSLRTQIFVLLVDIFYKYLEKFLAMWHSVGIIPRAPSVGDYTPKNTYEGS